MKLSRVLAFGLATLCSAQTPAIFKNPTAGLSVTKPAGWVYLTAEQNADNLKRTELSDQEFRAAVAKYATTPMVAMTKYPEPYADLNPSFKVNMRPLGELKGRSAIEITNLVLPQLQRAFADAKVVQPPMEVTVSGLKAAYARIDYTLRAGGEQFPTASELWIVPRGDFFFILGAGTRQDEKSGSRKEIETILKSIQLDQ
jgi:hypothetical protein